LLFILVTLFMPQGLLGLVKKLRRNQQTEEVA